MKGYVCHKETSDYQNLKLERMNTLSKIKDDEILVKIKYVSLNPCDFQVVKGYWPIHNKLPYIPGVDAAGDVVNMGKNVKNFSKGDRIFFFQNLYDVNGTFVEFTVVKYYCATKFSSNISYKEACCIPCAGLTAYMGICEKMNVSSNETVLIHGGNGGTGNFAIQLAKAKGSTVITTCKSKYTKFCQSIGADFVVNYEKEDVNKSVMEITNNIGVDAIFNNVSGSLANKDMELLKVDGSIACIAGRPGFGVSEYEKSYSIHEVYLGAYYNCSYKKLWEKYGKMGKCIVDMMERKKVKSIISKEYSFEELIKGLKHLESRKKLPPGKVIVKVS